MLREASKGVLFTVAIACLLAGSNLIQSELDSERYSGIILIALGIALIILYSYLLERQTTEKAVERVRRMKFG